MAIATNISRRATFLGIGALSLATVVPVAVAARPQPEAVTPTHNLPVGQVSPEDRMRKAVAEIQIAMREMSDADCMVFVRVEGNLRIGKFLGYGKDTPEHYREINLLT